MKTTGGNPVRGKPSLSQNMAATDLPPRIPVSHCHCPPVGYSPAGPPGGCGRRGREGGFRKEVWEGPPWVEPRPPYVSQLRSSQRPSTPGTQLKDTQGTGRPRWHQRVAIATRPRLHPTVFLFCTSRDYSLGQHGCVPNGSRQKSWPNNDPRAESDPSTSPLLSDRY